MGLYVYALVDEPLRDRVLGKGASRTPLGVVRLSGFYAIVERAAPPPPTTAALVAHDRVVRRIARLAPATLPMRFGTTLRDRASLSAALGGRKAAIIRALDRVRGAVQVTLRVEGCRTAPRLSRGLGPGARFLEERAARYRVPEIDVITAATRPFVREARLERQDDGERLASVYHLVDARDLRAWRVAFRRASRALEGVTVRASGPWPAWAFAELDGER